MFVRPFFGNRWARMDTEANTDFGLTIRAPQQQLDGLAQKVAYARFAFSSLASLYVGLLCAFSTADHSVADISIAIYGTYTLVAFVRWLYCRFTDNWPSQSHGHARLEVLTDIMLLTTAIALWGSPAFGLYAMYLWVIFGTGYFYGISAMRWTAGWAAASLSLVSYLSPAWETAATVTAAHVAGLLITFVLARYVLLAQRNHELSLVEYASAWERLAAQDPLSGLPNRRSFSEELRSLIHHERGCVLLLFDLDDFKRVNDTHGHIAGDAVLQVVAQRALNQIRSGRDTLVRLGGDEFAVIMKDVGAETGHQLMNRLRISVREPIQIRENVTISISISIGMATYPPDADTMTELIAAADFAMYRDKRGRKDGGTLGYCPAGA